MRKHCVEYGLLGRLADAHTGVAETQVDHLRRRVIRWNARHAKAGRPRDAVENVRKRSAAFAKHANRKDLRRPIDAGGPGMIVALGADDCGNRRAVPTAVFDRTTLAT